MVKICPITEWSANRMTFEYRTKFSQLFRPPFEYRTSKYRTSKSSLFRCFRYSDVRYSDPHCSPNVGIFLKLFQKWRRRWFVLEQGKLPGQYLLCYYTDEQKKRLKGTICLDECDQVCHVLCDLRSSLRFQSVKIS